MISLLITCRSRHEPASGANVSPLRRPLLTSPANPTVNASTRSDGRLIVVVPHEPGSCGGVTECALDHRLDVGVVSRRQRGEAHLVVPGAPQPLADHRADLLRGPLADRPGDHPRLAEAAPACAAAEDLDAQPVVDDLGERHEGPLRVRPIGEIGHGALVDGGGHVGVAGFDRHEAGAVVLDVVHRRHVDAGQSGELAEQRLASRPAGGLPVADDVGDLTDDLFAVAEHGHIDEVGERLGVERAVPTDHDQRMLRATVG